MPPNKRELLPRPELTEDEHYLLHWSGSRASTLIGQRAAITNCIAWFLHDDKVVPGRLLDKAPEDILFRVRVAQMRSPGHLEKRVRKVIHTRGVSERSEAIWRNRWKRHQARHYSKNKENH